MKNLIWITLICSVNAFAANYAVVNVQKMRASCEKDIETFKKANNWTDESNFICDESVGYLRSGQVFNHGSDKQITDKEAKESVLQFATKNAGILGITKEQVENLFLETVLKANGKMAIVYAQTRNSFSHAGFENVEAAQAPAVFEFLANAQSIVSFQNVYSNIHLPKDTKIDSKPTIELTEEMIAKSFDRELANENLEGAQILEGYTKKELLRGKPYLELYRKSYRVNQHWVGLVWTQRFFVGLGDVGSTYLARFRADDGVLIDVKHR